MGGGEKKKANQMLDTQVQTQNAEHGAAMSTISADKAAAQGRANDMYNVQYEGFKGLANPTAINFAAVPSSGGGAAAAYQQPARSAKYGTVEGDYNKFRDTGGIDQSAMRAAYPTYQNFQQTGGWDPSRVASMDQNIQGFKELGKTGGFDAESTARMRGNGVFDEFAQTGGYSAGDKQNIRSRATSTIPAFYSSMKQDANRMGSVQGGYGPGKAALMSRLGRQQASAGADAALNAELGITDKVNAGRQWGGANVASSEGAYQGQRTGNMLAGLTGAVNTESGMVNSINQGKMWGADSQTNAEKDIQTLAQQGKMYGTTGMLGLADSEQAYAERGAQAQAAAAGASASAARDAAEQENANARWNAEFGLKQKELGLGGMQSLYGMTPGEVTEQNQLGLAERGMTYDANGQLISNKLAANPSGMQNLGGALSAAAGIAGGIGGLTTGLTALRPKKVNPQEEWRA